MSNREYKSDVFCMLMENPVYALEVYNALNGTSYTDPSQVQMVTLEKGISLSMRNDASFIVDFDLTITEHQSTYSPNMPLRSLFYFVEGLKSIISNHDLLGRKLVQIPTPHFVVFYNGLEKRPEMEVLRLSNSFIKDTDEPEIELKCTVYNINKNNNAAFLSQCPVLSQYMFFVDRIRANIQRDMELENAIEEAIEYCIHQHILEDFLRQRRAEVTKTMTLDYTWERREGIIRREEREDGRAEGLAEGLAEGRIKGRTEGRTEGQISLICKKLRKNLSVAEIAAWMEEEEATVQAIVDVAKKYAPDYDEHLVFEEIQNKTT